jgi:hypothetical protein
MFAMIVGSVVVERAPVFDLPANVTGTKDFFKRVFALLKSQLTFKSLVSSHKNAPLQ